MRRQQVNLLTGFVLLCLPLIAVAQGQFWPGVTVNGDVKNHKQVKYYVDGEARFTLPPENFLQGIIEVALGYQANPLSGYWLGYTFASTRDPEISGVDRVSRLWQQYTYGDINFNKVTLTLRSRLEEGSQHGTSGIGLRFRQKFYFAFLGENKTITPEISEEIFINLTHPAWLNDNKFVDQNRLFIGVRFNARSNLSFDLGYMDQYQVSNSGNSNNNILYFNVNLDVV